MQLCLFSDLWSPGVLPVLRFTTPPPPHTQQFPLFHLAFSPRKGKCGCKAQNEKPRTDREGSWESPYLWVPRLGEETGAKAPLLTSIINQLSHLLGVN